jgi:hypothetical protein
VNPASNRSATPAASLVSILQNDLFYHQLRILHCLHIDLFRHDHFASRFYRNKKAAGQIKNSHQKRIAAVTKAEFKGLMSADRRTFTLELHVDDDPKVRIRLSTYEMDKFIADLGLHRALMFDEVPRGLDPKSRTQTIQDPAWRPASTPGHSGKALALRHPGLGWLGFLFPDNEAAAIAKYLYPYDTAHHQRIPNRRQRRYSGKAVTGPGPELTE